MSTIYTVVRCHHEFVNSIKLPTAQIIRRFECYAVFGLLIGIGYALVMVTKTLKIIVAEIQSETI